jgi:hypothetical protein
MKAGEHVRRLRIPTLSQWGSKHQWKTTTTRPGYGDIVRVCYLTCQRCGLKVKTEEHLAVPWDETDLVAQVKALMPEGHVVPLRDKGITELPLAKLNARLASCGYVIHASKGQDSKQLVACTGKDGQVEQFERFVMRPISPKVAAGMKRERKKERAGGHGKGRG